MRLILCLLAVVLSLLLATSLTWAVIYSLYKKVTGDDKEDCPDRVYPNKEDGTLSYSIFGRKMKTRNGRLAICVERDDTHHTYEFIIQEGDENPFYMGFSSIILKYTVDGTCITKGFDIDGKYDLIMALRDDAEYILMRKEWPEVPNDSTLLEKGMEYAKSVFQDAKGDISDLRNAWYKGYLARYYDEISDLV